MERPSLLIGIESPRPMSRGRIISLAFVGALHVLFVYALVSGLAVRAVLQLPHELIAQVVQPPQPKTEPPPPVTVNLPQPSRPTVEAPRPTIRHPRPVAQ